MTDQERQELYDRLMLFAMRACRLVKDGAEWEQAIKIVRGSESPVRAVKP